MSGPNAFVVVGDTDWWSLAHRFVDVRVDARLRGVATPNGNGSDWRSIYGEKSVSPALGQTLYFQIEQTATTVHLLGVSENRAVTTTWMANTASEAAGVFVVAGNIYKSGGIDQSGLSTAISPGDRVGIAVTGTDSGVDVQFYVANAPYGSAVSLAASTVWVGWSSYSPSAAAALFVDAPELSYLPAGAQPLGAAARVADREGHSRAATVWTSINAAVTVDSFLRTASSGTNARSVGAGPGLNSATVKARRLIYCEFINEVMPANGPFIGLAPVGFDTGNFVGATGRGWGYLCLSGGVGNLYFNGVASAPVSSSGLGAHPGWVWDPLNGKLWFTRYGVPLSGDPLAGTGEHYSGVFGTLVPACSPYNGGRVRLCTHAREQNYRPAYADACDGADLLPEQWFEDRLAAVPRIRRDVSYFIWANQRQRGATIGSLDLSNGDGLYDRLSEWSLRNQSVVAYARRSDGAIEREWTGLIDSVEHPELGVCRVEVADSTAPLDTRVPNPKLLLGAVSNLPIEPRQGTTLIYDVAQTPWVYGELQDRGLPYALGTVNWRFKSSAAGAAIERTSAPTGYQGFVVQKSFYALASIALTNGDLSSWSGGAPVGWSVHTWGTGSTVTQNGSAARIKGGATGGAGISQTFAVQAGRYYGLKVTISAYHAGTENNAPTVYMTNSPLGVLSAGSWNGTFTPLHAGKAAGEFWAPFFLAAESGWTSILLACFAGGEFSFDTVELFELADLSTMEGATRYLLQALPATAVAFDWTACPGYPTGGRHGTWTSQQPTIRQQFGQWLSAELADYWTDANGKVQIAWLLPPEEFTSGVHYLGVITEEDMRGPLRIEADSAPGLTDSWGYCENFARLNDTDIAGTTIASTRAYLTAERLVAKLAFAGTDPEDAVPFDSFYAHAVNGKPHIGIRDTTQTVQSVLNGNDPDLVTPAQRWNTLIRQHRCYPRGKTRKFYDLVVDREVAIARRVRPGAFFTCKHSRYGLANGKPMQIVAVESALTDATVSMRAWG